MNTTEAIREAKKHNACTDAIGWLKSLPADANPWEICERGDWMLWSAAKVGIDLKLIVTAGCKCARLALQYVPEGEQRPLHAIETAEAWTRGEATIEQVRVASDAASAADAAAVAVAVADAKAAKAAAYAAKAAAYAYAAARTKTLKECADIVREIIPLID